MKSRREIEAELTGPGGPFEIVEETVRGLPMKVYRSRMRSLREIPAQAVQRGDDQTFLVHGERRYGFRTFVEQANAVAAALRSRHGVGPGDRVAILSANNPEWCLAFWATVNLAGIAVGLNGWWKADEILYGIEDSGSKVLVADRKRFERIAADLDGIPGLEAVYLADARPEDLVGDPRLHAFDELLDEPAPELPDEPIDEDDPAVIFYTSGTTGRPKGAVSTHRSMIANLQNTIFNAVASALAEGDDPGVKSAQTVGLLTSPLFHVSGCHSNLVVGLAAGSRLVIPEGRFDARTVLEAIEREKVDVWATVPTMVWRVVEAPERSEYDVSSVRRIAYGGSPSAGELQRRIRETFPNVRSMGNAYGLTESSSVATIISGRDFVERPTSVGRPLPVVEVRVMAAPDREAAVGEPGEIQIYGPIIMPGYWNKPEATAETVVDGWLHTGDVGYLDEEGYLHITDRKKDMIIRGGENIYCVEIENRLLEHPEVADAAIIGVPHPSLGEEVKAVVQLEAGASVDAAALQAWVAETLADFKVPKYVEIREERLPRNASGKLLKNLLRGTGEVSLAETL